MQPWELYAEIRKAKYITVGNHVDYLVEIIEGRAVLLFEETTSDEDWAVNFDFPKKVYKRQESKMKVHGGYAKAWKTANDQIMAEFIQAVQKTDKKPLIAGWSYGGGMSVLAAEDFNYRTGTKADVVTFGAPKVAGNKATVKYLKTCGDFTEYANTNDVVPYCPPVPGFQHVNAEWHGDRIKLSELINPDKNHRIYINEDFYGGSND